MSTIGLYFLPTTSADTSPLPDLINRLTTRYNPSILPPWTLRQRLFRSTPAPPANSTTDGAGKITPPRYLQIVSLPDHPQNSFVAITPNESASTGEGSKTEPVATVISISSGPSTDEFNQLLGSKFGPLWQSRQILAVIDGSTYQIGDFRVRAGELRQGIGGAQLVRGVIAEVAYLGQDGQGEAKGSAERMITAFWQELGVQGVREFLSTGPGGRDDGFEDSSSTLILEAK
ncbi:MAG: hypothetical protein Q9201_000818 [Fulgogasparrea decipioides]